MQPLRQIKNLTRVKFAEDARYIGRQFHRLVIDARPAGKYDRSAGRNNVAVLEDEGDRCNADRHHHIKAHSCVFLMQEGGYAQSVLVVRIPCEIEKIGLDLKFLSGSIE